MGRLGVPSFLLSTACRRQVGRLGHAARQAADVFLQVVVVLLQLAEVRLYAFTSVDEGVEAGLDFHCMTIPHFSFLAWFSKIAIEIWLRGEVRTNVLGQSQPTLVEHLVRLLGTPTWAHGSRITGRIVLLFFEHDVRRVGGNEHGAAGLARNVSGAREGARAAIVRGGFTI